MKNLCSFRYLILLIVTVSTLNTKAQQTAFEGAVGWAAQTAGGRGGEIIRVTNLDADGPGSFQQAVKVDGKRIIVFEVGGVIDLKGAVISIKNPHLTIAGQTAPSPGITLIDGGINIYAHDVIVQHIRIRTGAGRHEKAKWEPDGLATIGAHDVIIDHCSMSWAVDENCSASGPRFKGDTPDDWRKNTSHRITISNNIISEGLSNSTHSKGEHSKGTLIHDNASDIMIYGNLYASNQDRNALFKGGARGVFANNYIFNPGKNAVRFGLVEQEWEGHEQQTGMISVVGNAMQLGPSSTNMPLVTIGHGPCQVYMHDNIARKLSGENGRIFAGDSTKLNSTKPVWSNNIKLLKSSQVRDYTLKSAGARPWDRDDTDKRIINEVLTLGGKVIDSEDQVGGYPNLKPTAQKFDQSQWDMRTMRRK